MRRLIVGSILLGIVFVFLAIAAVPDRADAIPAFAREHNAPCTMCHVAFPKLNSFGIDFKQRGYRVEGQEGTSVWESKSIPLAGMVMFKYLNKDEETSPTASTKTSMIELDEVEFFAAGTLGPRVSYFMDFGSEEGSAFTPGAAFIILDDILPDSLLNIKAGAYDAEFPFLSTPRRLTLRDYLVKIASDSDGAAPEGVSLGKAGAEVNGFHPAGFRYALGVGNDNAANADNNVTAIYAWATQSIPLAGQNQTIGVIYSSDRNGDETAAPATDDRTSAIGGVLDLNFGPANLIFGYFTHSGNDKLTSISASGEGDTDSLLAEVIVAPTPQLVAVGRYNYMDNGDTNVKNTEYVLHLGYYFLPNASLGLEYSKRTDDTAGTELDTDRIQAAVHFGF